MSNEQIKKSTKGFWISIVVTVLLIPAVFLISPYLGDRNMYITSVIVMILSILVFSVASSLLLSIVPALGAIKGTLVYRLIMICYKLLLLPLVVAIGYEINRLVGRYDNKLTRILTAPGMWFQNFTTNEPDDEMIEVGIASLQAVLPAEEGADRW